MTYEIKATQTFIDVYNSLNGNEKQWIENIKLKLTENPSGKILKFYWFREKKYLNKRLYYLIDEDSKRILLVAFASKKDQQKTIDSVILNMQDLLSLLKN